MHKKKASQAGIASLENVRYGGCMKTKKVKFSELNETVRSFFEKMDGNDIVMLEDEKGQTRFSIAPFFRASSDERVAAFTRLRQLQEKVRGSMVAQGIEEEDIDR